MNRAQTHNKLLSVVILLMLVVVLGLTTPVAAAKRINKNRCKPGFKLTRAQCESYAAQCLTGWGIQMKWTLTDGCQCIYYCGYMTQEGCRNDEKCYWDSNIFRCFSALTRLPGKPSALKKFCPKIPYIRAAQVTAAGATSCARDVHGKWVKCWGFLNYGKFKPSSFATTVPGIAPGGGITAMCDSRGLYICFVQHQAVKCWGDYFGDPTSFTMAVNVKGAETNVKDVACGLESTCLLTLDNRVYCWGNNFFGQLGIGSTTDADAPMYVHTLAQNVNSISAGAYHTCAITHNYTRVYCWGFNLAGETGPPETSNYTLPQLVMTVSGSDPLLKSVTAGNYVTCILNTIGDLKCWGLNTQGQVGDGSTISPFSPVQVFGLTSGVAQVGGAGQSHNCALLTTGQALCWGDNRNGQLGCSSAISSALIPGPVWAGDSTFVQISVGFSSTCAIRSDQGVGCWGSSFSRQVGDPVDFIDVNIFIPSSGVLDESLIPFL